MNIKKYFSSLFEGSDLIFTNNGRSALQALIEDFELQNSEIILPSFICSSTYTPLIMTNNLKPILVDCPKNSFNVTFGDIKKASKGKKPKALIVVHTYGEVNKEINKIVKWCRDRKIILVEDCAHCISSKGRYQAGKNGDASIFSFPKTLNVPVGGAYVRNKGKIKVNLHPYRFNRLDTIRIIGKFPFLANILRKARGSPGKNKSPQGFEKVKALSFPYFFKSIGFSKEKIDIEKRKKLWEIYHKKLRKEVNKSLPDVRPSNNSYHSFPLLVRNRDEIYAEIIRNKISCTRLWIDPLSKDARLSRLSLNRTPNADSFSEKILNLMINPLQSPDRMKENAEIISKIIKDKY